MHYLGGKSRIAKDIANIISPLCKGKPFVSLFCGACNIEQYVTGQTQTILNDKHEYLIALLRAIQQGYAPPAEITEDEYKRIKADRDKDKVLSGFVGFACSFGGKWFDVYVRANKSKRSYAYEGRKKILRTMARLKNAEIYNLDYRDVKLPQNAVVYCDPPYDGTTEYTGVGKFISSDFWDYIRDISKSHLVFVSEEKAPADFTCVWQKELLRCINACDYGEKEQYKKVTEKLFVYKTNAELIPQQLSLL